MSYTIMLRVAHTSFITRSNTLYQSKEVADTVKEGLKLYFSPKHIFWVQDF
jgi:hypothetical protein